MQEIGVVGSSIWQQNLPLLETLTIAPEHRTERLEELKRALEVDEMIFLATCNRVELIYASRERISPAIVLHRLVDFFFQGGRSISFFPNDFHQLAGREAISHIFRLVSSLDSVVMGETQITGQFKEAWQTAQNLGTTGVYLDTLAQSALQCARRVKRETTISEGSVSMASLSMDAIAAHVRGIESPRVALVGSVIMTHKMAKALRNIPDVRLLFVNRSTDKIEPLAAKFNGEAMALSDFIADPGEIDVVVSATSAPTAVFHSAFADRLLSSDFQTLCVDLAIPRDFDRTLDNHPAIKTVDIKKLKSTQQQNLRKKFVAAGEANRIVREDVDHFYSGTVEKDLRPVFQQGVAVTQNMAREALQKFYDKNGVELTEDQRSGLEQLVSKLIAKASFEPLRDLAGILGQSADQKPIISEIFKGRRHVG